VGYGAVNLSNALPLTIDPTTPSGLIVKDAGNPPGVTGPSNITLTAPLPVSTTTSALFDVVDAREPLTVVLTWVEPQAPGGALVSNLDLELRYCGSDQSCTTATAGTCKGPSNEPTYDRDGSACTSDLQCLS